MATGCKTIQGTAVIAPPPPPPPPPPVLPANIVVQSFDVSPLTGTVPFTARGSITWVNNGGSQGSVRAGVTVDGTFNAITDISLASGQSQTLYIDINVNDTNAHTVCPAPNP